MSKQLASNTFTEGLITDLNPLTTPNNSLTDCLNGTLITYNGKEFVLQNDMGNTVVERASLPMGYVPIGVKEYNGIVYVVAYNPLEQRVQFGSFPSPEIDFDGSDFDPEEYELEGVVFSTQDFYSRNKLHWSYVDPGTPIIDSSFEEQIAETLIPETHTEDVPYNPNNPFGIMFWEDNGDYIPNKYDAWTIKTDSGEPKFIISKAELVDSFESYEWLRLNPGDRYLIYYIDSIDSGDYSNVVEILKHYLSVPGEKRLFKAEVYSVSPTGRKAKLDINPFLYEEDDVSINILNGNLEENVKYNVFDGESNSTIEVRISLEKPEQFRASFKQYRKSNISLVKFRTFSASKSFMQIKGFRYRITKRLQGSESFSPLWGYMKYTNEALYDGRKQNYSLSSYVEITDLPIGVYDYVLTPFTQYGYELGMVLRGSFEVSDELIVEDTSIDLQLYNWRLTSSTDFHFELQTFYEVDDDETIVDTYAEFYDVWSNVSSILELNEVDGTCAWDGVIDLSTQPYLKTKIFNYTEFGGIPASETTTDSRAKLPSRTLEYQQNNIALNNPSFLRLQANRFYVFAMYYDIEDSTTGLIKTKGLYRYLYTNDKFNDFSEVDFSNLTHPQVAINLFKSGPSTNEKPESNMLDLQDISVDPTSYMFDPLLQTYNNSTNKLNPVVKVPWLIQPKFYKDTYYQDNNFKINYYKTPWFRTTQQVTNPIDLLNHVGDLNYEDNALDTNVLTITKPADNDLLAEDNRVVEHVGGSTVPESTILGPIEPQPLKYHSRFQNDQFELQVHQWPHKVYSKVVYDLTEDQLSYDKHISPLFYNQSTEIRERILEVADANINQALIYQHGVTELLLPYVSSYRWPFNIKLSFDFDSDSYLTPLDQNQYSTYHTFSGEFGWLDAQAFNLYTDPSVCISNNPTAHLYNSNSYSSDVRAEANRIYKVVFRDEEERFSPHLLRQEQYDGSTQATSSRFGLSFKFKNYDGMFYLYTKSKIEELVNFTIFSGYVQNSNDVSINDKYHKYTLSENKYTYEPSVSSYLHYESDVEFKYRVHDRQCYKICAPAISTDQIILNDNIQTYILSKFDFDDYDGANFLPRQVATSTKSINFLLDVDLTNGLESHKIPVHEDILNSTSQMGEHPIIKGPAIKYHLIEEPNKQMFHLKQGSSGVMLITNSLLQNGQIYYDSITKKIQSRFENFYGDHRFTEDIYEDDNDPNNVISTTLQCRYNLDD